MKNYVIGVDVGGTNIRVALINDKLEIVKKETALTKDINTIEEFFAKIRRMITIVDTEGEANAVGIVLPAPWTSEKERISDSTNVSYLEDVSIEKIKQAFAEYHLYFENDVNVIALLESDFGASKNSKHSIYITVSTGIGSGIIIHNKIYHGAHGYAGEIGSIIISEQESTKTHPLLGSLEELCSGKAMQKKSIQMYGEGATARQLFVNCERGEQEAVNVIEEWFEGLTRGLAAVIQMIDPDVIVMGGPMILNHTWIIERIKEEISQKLLGQLAGKTKIVLAKYGVEAGIIGAGYYALTQSEGENI